MEEFQRLTPFSDKRLIMYIQLTKKLNSYLRVAVVNMNQVDYMYQGANDDTVIVFSDHTITVAERIEDILKLM